MSRPIESDFFKVQLLAVLEELFERTQGIALDKDTSLIQTVSEMSAEQASRPVVPGGTSIAAHLEHACFYLDVMHDYITGKDVSGIDWGKSWSVRSLTEPEWGVIQQRLKPTYRGLVELIQAVPDWSDDRSLGGALGVAVHSAYHLGAIRQIRKIVL